MKCFAKSSSLMNSAGSDSRLKRFGDRLCAGKNEKTDPTGCMGGRGGERRGEAVLREHHGEQWLEAVRN